MAPQYAPGLRSRLPVLTFLLETVFIVLFAFHVEINNEYEIEYKKKIDGTAFTRSYAEFQDVHVMVFLGFGFLATFLVRYGFSGSGFTLLVSAMAVQWAVLMNGLLLSPFHSGKIRIGMKSLVFAEMCAASSLVAMGAVLGKTNPVQLLLMALLEVTGFVVNQWLLQTFFRVQPEHSIMLLHIFGAFFGVVMSRVLYQEGLETPHEKEKLDRKTGLVSMMGTLFLWMFWPSFNSALVDGWAAPERKLSAVCGTYLSLAVSAVTAIAISVLSSPRGKIHLLHVQSATLAGGVAVGVAISAVRLPWVAMTIGLSAALLSTLGFRYIKPHMQLAFQCHDTCGVLSVHGMPGILGWLAHLLLQLANSDGITIAIRFAVYHISILLTTLSMSLAMGAITGLLLKWNFWKPPQNRKCFDDQAFWEFPHLAVHK